MGASAPIKLRTMKTKGIYLFTFAVLLLSLIAVINVGYNAYIHEGDHSDHYGNIELAKKDNCWLGDYAGTK